MRQPNRRDTRCLRIERPIEIHIGRPGRAVSRRALAELSLSSSDDRDERTVDSHVARVRKKLGAAGARIATVWGIGYRFEQRSGE